MTGGFSNEGRVFALETSFYRMERLDCMVISVRAGGAACLGLLALTAAGTPASAGEPGLPEVTIIATDSRGEAPAYFVLGEQTPATINAPVETAIPNIVEVAPREVATGSEDERCLAAAVYYESRGEPLAGQRAVAQVILNRVRTGRFGGDVCTVVRAPHQFSFAHRSFTSTGSADWIKAIAVANAALSGGPGRGLESALYFHADYVAPGWGRPEVTTIGHHIFYR